METRSHELLNGWTLIMYKTYKVYSDKNSYVVLDPENDMVIRFTTEDNEIEVNGGIWNLNYKLNIGLKTLKLLNNPDEE